MNAIILAAGLGTRLRPLTNDRPKCMVEVRGIPMVERQIQCLKEINVTDITLVSGYCADKLEYLRGKYGVDIVHNPKYDTVNNIYSMYVAKERFGDTYVIEGDVYMHINCLRMDMEESAYFAVAKEYEHEWGLICKEGNTLDHVSIGNGNGCIMSGISYWTKADAAIIMNRIEYLVANADITNLFWDNAVLDVLPQLLAVKVNQVCGLYEIDTVENLDSLNI